MKEISISSYHTFSFIQCINGKFAIFQLKFLLCLYSSLLFFFQCLSATHAILISLRWKHGRDGILQYIYFFFICCLLFCFWLLFFYIHRSRVCVRWGWVSFGGVLFLVCRKSIVTLPINYKKNFWCLVIFSHINLLQIVGALLSSRFL